MLYNRLSAPIARNISLLFSYVALLYIISSFILPFLKSLLYCWEYRQVAVTCRRGTSVARSLKLLTLPQAGGRYITTIIILPTTCRYVILPYNTNTNQ